MDDVQSAIVEVVAEVSQLGVKLDKVEADVEAALSRGDKDEVVALRRSCTRRRSSCRRSSPCPFFHLSTCSWGGCR